MAIQNPINYTLNIPSPMEAIQKGMKMRAEMDALQRAEEQQRLFAEQQQAFLSNPNPTFQDASKFMATMNPAQMEGFKPFLDQLTAKQKQETLDFGNSVLGTMNTNPNVAINMLSERAVAEENSGNTPNANLYRQMAEDIKNGNTGNIVRLGAMMFGGSKEGQAMVENLAAAEEERRAQEEQPYRLGERAANIQQSQAAAGASQASAAASQARAMEIQALLPGQIFQQGLTQAKTQADIQKTQKEISRIGQPTSTERSNVLKEKNIVKADLLQTNTGLKTIESALNLLFPVDPKTNQRTNSRAIESITGGFESRTPTFGKENLNAEQAIEKAKGVSFLSATSGIDLKGVTATETQQISQALANLSLRQSPAAIKENLETIADVLRQAKMRQKELLTGLESLPASKANALPSNQKTGANLSKSSQVPTAPVGGKSQKIPLFNPNTGEFE